MKNMIASKSHHPISEQLKAYMLFLIPSLFVSGFENCSECRFRMFSGARVFIHRL